MIKDLIDVAGLPTTAGYKPFGAPVPPRDAFVVQKLHEAGAIVLAKVATVNWFGNGFDDTHPIGRTLNPYNLDYQPGGSSNGVGASMACLVRRARCRHGHRRLGAEPFRLQQHRWHGRDARAW